MAYIAKSFTVVLCSDSLGENEVSVIGKAKWRIYNGNRTLAATKYLTAATFLPLVESVISETALYSAFIGCDTSSKFYTFYTSFIPEVDNFNAYTGAYYIKLKSGDLYAVSNNATSSTSNPWGAAVTGYRLFDSTKVQVGTIRPILFTDSCEWLYFENIANNIVSGNAYYLKMSSISGTAQTCTLTGTALTVTPAVIDWINGVETDKTDPYAPGGTTGTGGGTGSFDGTGDNISIPSLPTLSAVDAGFITLFNPTLAQMHSLSSYMWSGLFDLDGWRKIFADPMDAILGLSIVPVAVPNGGAKEVKVGNISTGVSMTTAASQYVKVDCGTLNVNEYWGAYLDYDPYTKAEIYLPYIGTHPIAVDDIMSKSVHVVYHVDILSGACCAYVQCGGTVMYTFAGQCSSSIPITGDNWTRVVNGALSIAGAIGGMVATGGMSAPMAVSAAENVASNAINSSKPSVAKSGSMGGTGGMLGVQTPYLILTRPRQAVPENLNVYTGYPSYITTKLSDCTGYTAIDSAHLENIPATSAEINEIESLLKGGVIF